MKNLTCACNSNCNGLSFCVTKSNCYTKNFDIPNTTLIYGCIDKVFFFFYLIKIKNNFLSVIKMMV